ncbi:MAG TPA: ABC transporter substrate-binding protein [Stellaceae bacterium]|jgi:multiple sugar transport system substrate-binding protein
MVRLTRRSVLRSSLGLAAAGTLARPYIANAAATTATAWWVQGFFPEEDAAFRKLAADYEKASGNKIDYSIIPFAPMRQKIVSAITSGVVPDLIYATPPEVVPEQAWAGRLVDVSDVIETQKSQFLPNALISAQFYDNVEKKRSYYGVPFEGAVVPFHFWRDLIEKAGYKMSDVPAKWDAFIDFFQPVQKKLRDQGMRHVYASGFVVSTTGNDPLNTFHAFMIAYGGAGLVSKDGKLNSQDPQVKEAVITALTKLSSLYKNGYIPPGSVNWNDADDNNAFHSKLAIMDFDGTLSTELAMYHDKQAYLHDMITHGLPLSNAGKELPSQFGVNNAIVPKGAKNVEVAKDFAKYLIQPKVNNEYLKAALGRWLPVFPALAKNDPWWTDPADPHRAPYVKQGLDSPTIPFYYCYNVAYAQCRTEHIFNVAFSEIVSGGTKPEDAAAKAFARAEAIFAKYPIQEG